MDVQRDDVDICETISWHAQVFFATVGANASIAAVITSCPALFVFCFIQIAVHLAIILGAGDLLGFSRRDLLLASNANVGGGCGSLSECPHASWLACLPNISMPAHLCSEPLQHFSEVMLALCSSK